MGVDEPRPRLSWQVRGEGRDRRQTACEIRVATSAAGLLDGGEALWHDGPRETAATRDHVYGGPPLRPRTRYVWSVRVWDEAGRRSEFAAPACFETGLLDEAWGARWLRGPPPPGRLLRRAADAPYRNPFDALPVAHLRRAFRVERAPARARLYATALGVYQASLNGHQVAGDLLSPGWTDYAKRLDYQTHDVTQLIVPGENVLGAMLGEGWYSGYLGFYPHRRRRIYGRHPQFRALLILEDTDGTTLRIATDPDWRVARGPRVYSDLLKGERFDARLSVPGWDEPGFDAAAWARALPGAGTRGTLKGSRAPPVRVTRDLEARSVSAAPDGSFVFDLGQNMVGRMRLAPHDLAPGGLVPGQTLTLTHAEMLNPDGTLYRANLRSAAATDVYVSAGRSDAASWAPAFTVHGFRYVAIAGLAVPPPLSAVRGEVMGSALEETIAWESSHPGLNRLHSNIVWSQRGNLLSVPTDCPQRDERLGWMADVGVFLPTMAYLMDVQAFMTKWTDDVLDAQSPAGAFPDVAPRGPHWFDGAPAWGDAGVIVPMTLFRRYGDRRLLARCYPAMQAWTALILRRNPDGLRRRGRGLDYGDWLSAGETTPKRLVATAYFAIVAHEMAEAAAILGRPEDEARYRVLYAEIRAAFQARFVGEDGRLEGDTQTGYLLALSAGLMPETQVAAAVRHLVANIARRGDRLATGFLGVRLLLPELTRRGHAALAYRLLLAEEQPSWLYPVRHGATTVWERWDGWTAERGFGSPRMNSFNHYALGSVGEWLVGMMAGIADARDGSAFRSLRIAPVPGDGVAWCRATYTSPHGPIASAWRRDAKGTSFDVELPSNTEALVILLFPEGARLLRDGAAASPDRLETHHGTRCAVMAVGSGTYAFTVLAPAVVPAHNSMAAPRSR